MTSTAIKYIGVLAASSLVMTTWNIAHGVNVSDIGTVWYIGHSAMAAVAGISYMWALK